jgi:hypothetical protein
MLAIVVGFSGLARSQGRADSRERHVIDFSQSDNLKVWFDARLRPLRIPGLESADCDIDEALLTIRLPGGRGFDLDVQRASFSILEGNAIESARFPV